MGDAERGATLSNRNETRLQHTAEILEHLFDVFLPKSAADSELSAEEVTRLRDTAAELLQIVSGEKEVPSQERVEALRHLMGSMDRFSKGLLPEEKKDPFITASIIKARGELRRAEGILKEGVEKGYFELIFKERDRIRKKLQKELDGSKGRVRVAIESAIDFVRELARGKGSLPIARMRPLVDRITHARAAVRPLLVLNPNALHCLSLLMTYVRMRERDKQGAATQEQFQKLSVALQQLNTGSLQIILFYFSSESGLNSDEKERAAWWFVRTLHHMEDEGIQRLINRGKNMRPFWDLAREIGFNQSDPGQGTAPLGALIEPDPEDEEPIQVHERSIVEPQSSLRGRSGLQDHLGISSSAPAEPVPEIALPRTGTEAMPPGSTEANLRFAQTERFPPGSADGQEEEVGRTQVFQEQPDFDDQPAFVDSEPLTAEVLFAEPVADDKMPTRDEIEELLKHLKF